MGAAAAPARYVVAVGSGKGGVGKSTVAVNLALALREGGAAVGILDADFYGPNVPQLLGLTRVSWTAEWTLARRGGAAAQPAFDPVERHGLKIASTGFILGEDQSLGIDAVASRLLASQLMRQVRWGHLDYLVVDLPPGTAAAQQVFAREIPISGAIVVVTPQDLAHLDGRKAIQMYRQARVPILGAVENMSGYRCPHCGERAEFFPRVSDERSIWAMGVEKLGSLPFDPAVGGDQSSGRPALVAEPASPIADAFREITARVIARLTASNSS